MRRVLLLVLNPAFVATGALVLAGFGGAATATASVSASASASVSATSIVGTWSGHLTRPAGSHASPQHFVIVIAPGERRGTWRTSSTCAGTLRLKDISYGWHHYYRVAGAHPGCAAPGVDCLQRSGARMIDAFVPNAGGPDIDGTFRRIK